jgi:hypothetical protein
MNSQANQPHRIGALVRDVALFWGGERQPQMHFPCNSVSRAIENQQLVLGEQRFGDHRAKAARPQQASERHNKVHEKGGQVTHDPRSAPTTPHWQVLNSAGIRAMNYQFGTRTPT